MLKKLVFQRKNYCHFLICLCALIISSCRQDNTELASTTDQLETPVNNEIFTSDHSEEDNLLGMPLNLDCNSISQDVDSGATWNGLTIGISSYDEVQTQLSPNRGEFNSDTNTYLFWNYESDDWSYAQVCFVDNKLAAMNIFQSHLLTLTLDEWQSEFGEPDVITWSNNYISRSVIWAEEGILAVIDQYPYGKARNVIFFSPISSEHLPESWIMNLLPTEQPGLPPGAIRKPTPAP